MLPAATGPPAAPIGPRDPCPPRRRAASASVAERLGDPRPGRDPGQRVRLLRISQRTVERYVKDQIRKPRPDLAARLEAEVRKRWQPQIRARAKERASTTDGIVIDTRARLGYAAPAGTTDQDRIRHLTVALPPQYAARLFDAQQAGATDQRLRQIAAEALRDVYFQDGGRRAGSLEEVRFTDVEHIEFDL
ncbi:telomere-protecting terminal protein Tpg [Streptomyces sp. NPDC059466]|uniref:telomere-protecting terminal protein Tpg n=1 Tax=unclassified Streptomyces TaxID=2593676 RepID=UPI0036A3E781